MATECISIELLYNYSIRRFHVSAKITNEATSGSPTSAISKNGTDRWSVFRDRGETSKAFKETTAKILRLCEIAGVSYVEIDEESITIHRHLLVDWPEFEDDAINVIKEMAGWTDDNADVEVVRNLAGRQYHKSVTSQMYRAYKDKIHHEHFLRNIGG